ncbi:Mak16 protein C-terminal region [Musa troglodytarum]|uniref:Mak16 protein C-terminal region n=1 Tax=Musa troglodytarum TaxID=320322 RepID=A0A9E7LEI7_9LILI|nr:Mak16 protein C-terminal region [Musa troglodytarum]
MQHDDVIWEVIRHNHCSYMAKITTGNFCRNPYNVTGICNRSSCPLANSRYATIRDHDGVFYLYMKTIERAHKPNELWERVKLPRNYEMALETIGKHLEYWPKLLVHKIKQRLTKMTQEKIMTVPRKEKKREARREEKAEKAAILDKSIENELLERLKKGVYGDIYNYPVQAYNNVLEMEGLQPSAEEEDKEEPEVEYVEGYDGLEEEEDMEDFGGFMKDESLMDDDYDEMDEENEEIEPLDQHPSKKIRKASASKARKIEDGDSGKKSKRKGRVIIEFDPTILDSLCSSLTDQFSSRPRPFSLVPLQVLLRPAFLFLPPILISVVLPLFRAIRVFVRFDPAVPNRYLVAGASVSCALSRRPWIWVWQSYQFMIALDHSLNGKVDELDKAIAVAVRDPAWYGLDEVELEKRRRWTSTARYQVANIRKTVEAGKEKQNSFSLGTNGVRKELMGLLNDHASRAGRSNNYINQDNDDFISSESYQQLLHFLFFVIVVNEDMRGAVKQDEELDELSASVWRIGDVGVTIHDELVGQGKILAELGMEMETTSNRLDFVQVIRFSNQ